MKSEQTMALIEHSSSNETMSNMLIDVVFRTAFGGVVGAVIGGLVGMVTPPKSRGPDPRALESLSRTQYALVYARDFSATSAAMFGIGSIMKGIKGKDDLTSNLVSGSGAGLTYALVTNGLKVKPALSWAAVSAVVSGIVYKVIC